MMFPSTACLVQKKIGATNAWGFDLSSACSGFIFALQTGASFIETKKYPSSAATSHSNIYNAFFDALINLVGKDQLSETYNIPNNISHEKIRNQQVG